MKVARRLTLDYVAHSVVGPRSRNEDRWLAQEIGGSDWLGVFAVADGLGGHGGGELASQLAINELEAAIGRLPGCDETQLDLLMKETFKKIGSALRARQNEGKRPDLSHMGTTLSVLTVRHDVAYIHYVGDSRVYLWRQSDLRRLTEDHTVGFRLWKEGALTRAQYLQSPMRDRLYRYLGGSEQCIGKVRFPVKPNDFLFVVSDGTQSLGWQLQLANNSKHEGLLTRTVADWFSRESCAQLEDNATMIAVHLS